METAKEIVQDVFTDLWRRRKHLEISTSFAAYIRMAIKYTILDHIRNSKVKEKYVEAIRSAQTERDDATIEKIAYRELDHFLKLEIAKLPTKCRQVFKFSRIEQLTNREIAARLHISHKTAENQITKALRVLRSSIQEFTTCLLLFLFS